MPRVLDLFCGAGGAGYGYSLAGFEVVGVDIAPQPLYPFEFIQADAFEAFATIGGQFDLVHASPPCQAYSSSIKTDGRWSHGKHLGFNEPKLIGKLRSVINDVPYVIENVRGAASEMDNPFRLCGAMFGLKIQRHRYFETNLGITTHDLGHPPCLNLTHPLAEEWIAIDPDHRNRRIYSVTGKQRQTGSVEVWKALMEMPWVTSDFHIAPAVPPAYTKWIGEQAQRYLTNERVRCEACEDWYCARHEGHIGEMCNCWPCDDCGLLFPIDNLIDGMCRKCSVC